MTIPEFIRICDAYCAQAGVSRTWLSKRLLKDTTRLQQLANGSVDIGVKRLERAVSDLKALSEAPGAPTQEAA